jgi:hypothetical protein
MQEKKNKWVKFGAVFAIVIMVVSAVLVGLIGFGGEEKDTELSLSDIPGTQANFTFKNAIDGSTHVPEGVLSISILKVYADDAVDKSLKDAFPGAEADKIMMVSYPAGRVDYYSLTEESNASITLIGKPQYNKHEGYNILFLSSIQRAIAGNPLILASFYDYTVDNSLAKKAVDVLAGKSPGSADLKDILAHADDVDNYDEIIVYKANAGSSYDKYYERSSQFFDMSTLQLTFQTESIVLKPDADMKAEIRAFAGNATGDNKITVTEEGDVLKIYIDSTNAENFLKDRNVLYNLISDNTAQGSNSTP